MLDPAREITQAMPARLAEKVRREAAADEPDLAAVHSWAAFTHQGR